MKTKTIITDIFHLLHKKKLPKRLKRQLATIPGLFLAGLIYTLLFHVIIAPQPAAVIEDRDLSIVFASTDIPPYSISESLLHAISTAKKEIHVLIYALHDKMIIGYLREASEKRGIKVSVVVDPSATEDASFHLGPTVQVYERKFTGLTHSKILIVDRHKVWYGTMNFVRASLTYQGNMACGVQSRILAHHCLEYIDNLIHKKKYTKAVPIKLTSHEEQTHAPTSLYFALHPAQAKVSFDELIRRIESAKKQIFVAMFTFTHPQIAQKLIEARQRGVDVRILFDKDSSKETSKKIFLQMFRHAVPAGVRTKSGLLHYKCAIIDSSFVIGSCNWTKAGFQINSETFSIIDNVPSSLQQFLVTWWNTIEYDSTLKSTLVPLQIL